MLKSDRGAAPRLRRGVAGVLGLAVVLASALLGSTAGTATAQDDEQSTLRVATATAVTTFNPFLSYYDGELNVIGNIYPSLMSLDQDGKPVPYLAESYETSEDNLTWTFKIRDGLTWTDGEPITAQDAAWTFNLIMSNPIAATANGSLVSNFKTVEAPDDTTLVITTKEPQANMLYVSIPISGIAIVPQHVWEGKVDSLKGYKNMEFPVVGYGPWILAGNVTNQYTTLKANEDFFMGAPKYDRLITQYFSNSDAAVAALQGGQLDQLGGVTATQFDTLQDAPNIKTYQQASDGWTAIEINSGAKTRSGKPIGTGNPILKDDTVRKAIALALNRQKLVDKVINGRGIVGAGYLPPGYPQFFWTPSEEESLSYNPDKANALLDEAGYTMGDNGIRVDPKTGKPLMFRFGIHSDDTGDAQIAPYVQEWLKAVGIGTKVEAMSFDQLNVNLSKGDWDMLMDGWSTGPDPTYLLSIQTCATLPLDDGSAGNTDSFYCNPEYDALFNKQITQFDQGERAETIKSMQEILYQANADIILYYKNGLSALRTDKVGGYLYGEPDSEGFYPLQNQFTNWRTAAPATGEDAAPASSQTGLWIGLGIAAVVVVALVGTVVLRRRATAGLRE